jgi:hypothetical protein
VPIDGTNMKFMVYGKYPNEKARNNNLPCNRIKLSCNRISGSRPSLEASNMFCYRSRTGTPEIVETQIEDYFQNDLLQVQKKKLNGIAKDIFPSDYYVVGDENYYIKSCTLNIAEHETEIEAINYPY